MSSREFIENRVQVGTGGRKRSTGCVANLPYDTKQVLTFSDPTSWALWRLSLVLKEIVEKLEP